MGVRFILKNERLDKYTQLKTEDHFTIDNDLNALERALLSGGYGEDAYDRNTLIGCEIIEATTKP